MNTYLIIYFFLTTLGLGMSIAEHGKERKPQNAWNAVLGYIIGSGLIIGYIFTN